MPMLALANGRFLAGPIAEASGLIDLGHQVHNRSDWNNQLTTAVGLSAEYQMAPGSLGDTECRLYVQLKGLWCSRGYLDRGIVIPYFRSDSDFNAGLNLILQFDQCFGGKK